MEALEQVIKEFYEEEVPLGITRELETPLNIDKVITIYGLRRTGKSYYLYQLINDLIKQGAEKERITYINFEDERLEDLKSNDLQRIVEISYQYYSAKEKHVYFFDEIQEISGWEKFIRRLSGKEKAKIYITGSSSKLLSREIATSLRGRTLSYQLFSFSFREFLKAKGFNFKLPLTAKERGRLGQFLDQYLQFGGYPEIIPYAHQEKLRTLKEYLDLVIYRDLVERFDIKQIGILKLLIRAAVESCAKELSLRKYYNYLKSQGRKISKNILYFYFSCLEEINFVTPIKKFSWKMREVEGSVPKIYLNEIGYLTLFGKDELGRKIENIVCLELLRLKHYLNILLEIYYYKTRGDKEVDFVIREKSKTTALIQVCLDIENHQTYNREVYSLLEAAKELRCKNLLIINMNEKKPININGFKILLIPLWQFLLNPAECIKR